MWKQFVEYLKKTKETIETLREKGIYPEANSKGNIDPENLRDLGDISSSK